MTTTSVPSKLSVPSELRNCVNVEVAFLGSQSLIVLMVSADIKQQ